MRISAVAALVFAIAGQAAACIARAREDNANAIGLFTSELMQPAHHVYRALGFRLESELPARYGIRYFRFVLPFAA